MLLRSHPFGFLRGDLVPLVLFVLHFNIHCVASWGLLGPRLQPLQGPPGDPLGFPAVLTMESRLVDGKTAEEPTHAYDGASD